MSEKSIKKAILFPSYNQIEEFAEELENIEKKKLNLSYILQIFMTVARYQDIYSLQRVLEFCEVELFYLRKDIKLFQNNNKRLQILFKKVV